MKVVITGGSGLIGRHLASALLERGDRAVILSRDPRRAADRCPTGCEIVRWDPLAAGESEWEGALVDADAVVNLSGSGVGAWPWTAARKAALVESRLTATAAVVDALQAIPIDRRPRVLVSASGTDAYEGRDAVPATEEAPPTMTFLARLCTAWEAAARQAERLGVRVVRTRFSLVVSSDAPALRRLVLPVRLCIGGRIGTGRQWISWTHIDDAVGIILLALDRTSVTGPVNVAAPDPRTQEAFVAAVGRAVGRPTVVPMPAWVVQLVLGEQSTLVLGSRRVWPQRVLGAGYRFRYPCLEEALEAELSVAVPLS